MYLSSDQLTKLARSVEVLATATKFAGQDHPSAQARRMPPSEIAALIFVGRNEGAKLNDLAALMREAEPAHKP